MNSGLRENVFLIIDMKINLFMAMATLVVSVAAVVGVKAYNYYSMPELMRANLEALSTDENTGGQLRVDCAKDEGGCFINVHDVVVNGENLLKWVL